MIILSFIAGAFFGTLLTSLMYIAGNDRRDDE